MKKLFAFLLCFVLLSACARQAPPADTTPPATSTDGTTIGASNLTGKDAANTYLVNDNFQCLTESDSAIYKLVSSRDFILITIKAAEILVPCAVNPTVTTPAMNAMPMFAVHRAFNIMMGAYTL